MTRFDFTPALMAELLERGVTRDYDAYDAVVGSLVLRCRTTGHHSWRVRIGRRWRHLGQVTALSIAEARRMAHQIQTEHLMQRAKDHQDCRTDGCPGPAHRWRLGRLVLLVCQTCAGHWTLEEKDLPAPLAAVGAQTRERRIALGLTAEEVATRAGVSRTTVIYLEQGRTQQRTKQVLKVLATLDSLEDKR